jgi:2-haloacid dehalogenase
MTVLKNVKACVFDAYGTLFDVHSAIGRQQTRLGEHAESVSRLWRQKQLEYTWLRSLMGAHADFWQITGEALDFALATFHVSDRSLCADLMQAYLSLDCYPEVPDVLAALKSRGLRAAILSNGTRQMIDAANRAAGLEDLIDHVYTVGALGIYKPHPSVYRLACQELDLTPDEICFLSSNAWDAAGAAHFGFQVVWINRTGQQAERLPGGAEAELDSLAGLPTLLG